MENNLRVADAMSKRLVFVRAGERATKARSLFRKTGYRSLPVVDAERRLRGIITRGDMLSIASTKSNVSVEGIMSSPLLYLTPDEELFTAAKKMLRANVGRAVVVSSKTDRKLVGMLSSQDVLKAILEKGYEPRKKKLSEIMSEELTCCSPEDSISKVWATMERTGYSGIPVVKKNKLVGMVTRQDIISKGYARISSEDEKGRIRAAAVSRVMATPALSISKDAQVEDAINLLLRRNIGRLPVVDSNNRLVGIVDREDLLRQYIR